MSITTVQPHKQLFTLLVRNLETQQTVIAQYNSSAILTTDQDALIEYTHGLILHYGKQSVYTISMVTPVESSSQYAER